MTDAVKSALSTYTQYISSVDGVKQIFLFGSYVNGNSHSESDIDLMVVVDNNLDPLKTNMRINKALVGKRFFPLDILVNRASAFEEAAEAPTLQNHIKNEGILLYAAD